MTRKRPQAPLLDKLVEPSLDEPDTFEEAELDTADHEALEVDEEAPRADS
jgi:hypothetical protein